MEMQFDSLQPRKKDSVMEGREATKDAMLAAAKAYKEIAETIKRSAGQPPSEFDKRLIEGAMIHHESFTYDARHESNESADSIKQRVAEHLLGSSKLPSWLSAIQKFAKDPQEYAVRLGQVRSILEANGFHAEENGEDLKLVA